MIAGDNPQINTLLAWSEKQLYVVLTNQSPRTQDMTLTAGEKLTIDPAQGLRATLRLARHRLFRWLSAKTAEA